MSLLLWSEPIDALARALSSDDIRIVLGDCRLRMPALGGQVSVSIACSAVVSVSSKNGFDVEIQGALLPGQSVRMFAAALQVEPDGPYRLRGKDVEGATWFAGDLRLQVSVDEVAGVFRAKLSPNWISVRAPAGFVPAEEHTELALDSEVKLPALDYQFEADASAVREPAADAGRIESNALDLYHSIAGRYRVVSIAGPACSNHQSLRNLLDAIAFVNGRRVDTELTRVSTSRGTSLHIHRRRHFDHMPMPPVRWAGQAGMRRVWRVLWAYWTFAEAHGGDGRPKVSQVLAELHAAQAPAYISAKALIAAVAVEALVNRYIRGQGARTREEVRGFKAIIREMELPDDVKEQCLNAVGYMTRGNAAGRLRALAAAGVLPDEVTRRWIEGRPRLAHGTTGQGSEDAATFLGSQTVCHATVLGLIGIEDEYEARSIGRIDLCRSVAVPPELREPL